MAFSPLSYVQMPDPLLGLSFNDGLLKLLDAASAGPPLPGTTLLDCASLANEPGSSQLVTPVRLRVDSVLRVCTSLSCPTTPPPPTVSPVAPGQPATAKLAVPLDVTFPATDTATVGGVDIYAHQFATPPSIDALVPLVQAWLPPGPHDPPVLLHVYVVTDPGHAHALDGFTIAIPTYPTVRLPPL